MPKPLPPQVQSLLEQVMDYVPDNAPITEQTVARIKIGQYTWKIIARQESDESVIIIRKQQR
jgi:hypothetical protein